MLCIARKRTYLWILKLVMNQAPINCVGYLPVLIKLLEASYWGLMMFELSLITWTAQIKKWWFKKNKAKSESEFLLELDISVCIYFKIKAEMENNYRYIN